MEKVLQKIVRRIQACVGNRLEFIVLFGSRARGKTLPLSDIDLGVKASVSETEYGKLQLELAELFTFDSPPRIDIVLLDAAPLTLKYRVVRDGRILYQRTPEVWPTFVEEVLSRYPDWKIYLDHYLAEAVGV
ncbi:MAG: nucleotidyltransferase domain-containing protein [Candidatus Hermodarchaeota archaeon]|nr:nucleotidyltransferase domain-containing protein [Candidatus Hermodarchaeota archaeon]